MHVLARQRNPRVHLARLGGVPGGGVCEGEMKCSSGSGRVSSGRGWAHESTLRAAASSSLALIARQAPSTRAAIDVHRQATLPFHPTPCAPPLCSAGPAPEVSAPGLRGDMAAVAPSARLDAARWWPALIVSLPAGAAAASGLERAEAKYSAAPTSPPAARMARVASDGRDDDAMLAGSRTGPGGCCRGCGSDGARLSTTSAACGWARGTQRVRTPVRCARDFDGRPDKRIATDTVAIRAGPGCLTVQMPGSARGALAAGSPAPVQLAATERGESPASHHA